jgi:cold shock CspA family protein
MSESDNGIHFPTTTDKTNVSKTSGRVKWFNNKSGYGFITISAGDHEGTDIFVHHSSITVDKEQYRYLVQGEYVEFVLKEMVDSEHKWQASDVSGISGGKLMCETRLETRATRTETTTDASTSTTQKTQRSSYRVRPHGPGPREGDEWMLVRRRASTGRTEHAPARSRPPLPPLPHPRAPRSVKE